MTALRKENKQIKSKQRESYVQIGRLEAQLLTLREQHELLRQKHESEEAAHNRLHITHQALQQAHHQLQLSRKTSQTDIWVSDLTVRWWADETCVQAQARADLKQQQQAEVRLEQVHALRCSLRLTVVRRSWNRIVRMSTRSSSMCYRSSKSGKQWHWIEWKTRTRAYLPI